MTNPPRNDRDDTTTTLNRRGLLKCAAWAGSGVLWTLRGGVLAAADLAGSAGANVASASLSFVQISDSHIGFNKPANPHPETTLQQAVAQIRALPHAPAFVVHTGDVSHLSQDAQFDVAAQILANLGCPVHYVPGEHDVIGDQGAAFFQRFNGSTERRWYSFDHAGAHFVALVNVLDLQAGGYGRLGDAQLAWLADDLRGRSSSTPLVVLAHMPLWTVYADWGWGTDDAAQALALMKRFGSVTVLNGHIHQIMQKVEGQVLFHTARSTAFPQPAPGTAAGPGPLAVSPGALHTTLGITSVIQRTDDRPLTLVDSTLPG
jgi:3',5'-cyclic AMP phosphodiesterase CpdA